MSRKVGYSLASRAEVDRNYCAEVHKMTADAVLFGVLGAGALFLLQVLGRAIKGPHGRKVEFRKVFGCLPGDPDARFRVAAWIAYLTARVGKLAEDAERAIAPGALGFVEDPKKRWPNVLRLARSLEDAREQLQQAADLSGLCPMSIDETTVVRTAQTLLLPKAA